MRLLVALDAFGLDQLCRRLWGRVRRFSSKSSRSFRIQDFMTVIASMCILFGMVQTHRAVRSVLLQPPVLRTEAELCKHTTIDGRAATGKCCHACWNRAELRLAFSPNHGRRHEHLHPSADSCSRIGPRFASAAISGRKSEPGRSGETTHGPPPKIRIDNRRADSP